MSTADTREAAPASTERRPARILVVEHDLYPRAIRMVLDRLTPA